jgi:uncharacterized protein YktA (UPF0223 family)
LEIWSGYKEYVNTEHLALGDLYFCASITSPQNEKQIDRLFTEQETGKTYSKVQYTTDSRKHELS